MDTRKELADMIDSMSEEQFTQFFIKAIQDPETRAEPNHFVRTAQKAPCVGK